MIISDNVYIPIAKEYPDSSVFFGFGRNWVKFFFRTPAYQNDIGSENRLDKLKYYINESIINTYKAEKVVLITPINETPFVNINIITRTSDSVKAGILVEDIISCLKELL